MAVTPFEVAGLRAELHTIKRDSSANAVNGRCDFDDPDVPYGAVTAYAVVVDGERIGVVSSKRGTSHRKAGRLITRTFHPVEWVATMTGFWRARERLGYGEWQPVPEGAFKGSDQRNAGDWFQQRKDAAHRVLEVWQEMTG
jgi:hypothetical protein